MPAVKIVKDSQENALFTKHLSVECREAFGVKPMWLATWGPLGIGGSESEINTPTMMWTGGPEFSNAVDYFGVYQDPHLMRRRKQIKFGGPLDIHEPSTGSAGFLQIESLSHRYVPEEIRLHPKSLPYGGNFRRTKEVWQSGANNAYSHTVNGQVIEMARLVRDFASQTSFRPSSGDSGHKVYVLLADGSFEELFVESSRITKPEQVEDQSGIATFVHYENPAEANEKSVNSKKLLIREKLHIAFEQESIEDGIAHIGEQIVAESIDNSDMLDWCYELCLDVEHPTFAASLLRCLGRLPLHGTENWRENIISSALASDDMEIRYAAVKVAETWGEYDLGLLRVLCAHEEPERWIHRYLEDVIESLAG